ncbi:MAG: F0F1 ATP synthase subunit epsilon [Actinomycetota bacterium]|jgi:F-type H+-transporting ATPase subunit epsilon|nr:F0F1 ATP synthase subunit epsilon [Actinomycetota bacterium]
MATPFHAEVVTPERVLFAGEVDEVLTRTDVGEIAFLAHHTEFVGALDITVVTVRIAAGEEGSTGAPAESSGERQRFAVHGGFVHMANNRLSVLAGVAERADEIDVARSRAALEAARERLGREGAPSAPDRHGAEAAAEPEGGTPLSGARLALLAPASAAAALRRAEVRLEAAGATESA